MKLKFIWLVAMFLCLTTTYSQTDVFDNEVTQQNGLLLYKGKPFTGNLYSEEGNKHTQCDCILKAGYKNGKLNGSKKEWYKNGNLKFSGKYVNGKENGVHTYYYENGKKKQVIKYRLGKITEKTIYYANGRPKKKETYSNGQIVSSLIFRRDGTLKNKNAKPVTVTKTVVSSNPVPESENEIAQKVPKKTDKKVKFVIKKHQPVENNQPQSSIKNEPEQPAVSKTYVQTIDQSNYLDGLHQELDENGLKKRVLLVKDGLKVKDSLFYTNGQLQLVKKYSDGELIHFEKYNEQGKIIKEENFLNNKKNGLQQDYYDNGTPKLIESYESGLLAHQEKYNEQGTMMSEKNFRFGKPNGLQKTFDQEGDLTELKEFNMGVLIRHEKYTANGKELIKIKEHLAQIKLFNNNDRLVEIKYENIKTKQPDSLWQKFDAQTGEKIEETAYNNGKIVRKGSYVKNQKNGKWVIYWKNGKKETRQYYQNGKLLRSETLTYARQIKNNITDSDLLFNFLSYTQKKSNNYMLVRLDSVKNTSEEFIRKEIIKGLENNWSQITPDTNIKDTELKAILSFSDYQIRLKSKNNANKKFITFIGFTLKLKDFETGKDLVKNIVVTPATEKKPNINSHYVKDKKQAFFKTIQNLGEKVNDLIFTYYPVSAIIRTKSKSGQQVNEVFLNIGQNKNIKEDDLFNVVDDDGQPKAKLKVTKVFQNASFAKVTDGKKWLFSYLQQHKVAKSLKTKK